jgi:hypothetical protein
MIFVKAGLNYRPVLISFLIPFLVIRTFERKFFKIWHSCPSTTNSKIRPVFASPWLWLFPLSRAG